MDDNKIGTWIKNCEYAKQCMCMTYIHSHIKVHIPVLGECRTLWPERGKQYTAVLNCYITKLYQ